jgi:predicted DNA-binding transcriptional regulator YafY
MSRRLTNKQRLLKVQDILKKHTDEQNQLTVRQIIDYIETDEGVSTSAVRDDLKKLADSRIFDVIENQETNGLEKYYSHQARLFEIHELRMLVDAVTSAKFITNSDTENLVNKLKKLTSFHLASQLENQILLAEGTKTENNSVKYTINTLHEAIWSRNLILFQYGRYDLSKEFQLSRNGETYLVKPYALVWNNDYYYLIAEYVPKGDVRHYRVDRMRDVSSVDQTFEPDPDFDVTRYTHKLFHMYSGEERSIELEFDNQLINVVLDRFGLNVNVRPHSEQTFRISTNVIISEGLIRWLLTWGSDAKVLNPPSLINRMKEEAEKLYNSYH